MNPTNNKFVLLFCLCLLSTTILQAQITLNPRHFDSGKRTIVFEDNMDDDHNGWVSGRDSSSTISARIYNGGLYLQGSDSTFSGGIVLPELFDGDFEIDFAYRIHNETDGNPSAVAIAWGVDTGANKKELLDISPQGKYHLAYCLGGEHKNCNHNYANVGELKKVKDKFIAIRIRHAGEKYYIFVNGRLCQKGRFFKLHGNMLYLAVMNNATVVYDYIRVSYLE